MAYFDSITKHARTTGILAGLCLCSCASVPNPAAMPNGNYSNSVKHIPYAATAPIRDLNIGIKPVPRQLALLQNPYGTDTTTSCTAILRETRDIQKAIKLNERRLNGPHYDRKTRAGNIGEAAHEIIESAATSIIPYRGIVRYASGAYRRQQEGQDADKRGRERLSFLIGVGVSRKCPGFYTPPQQRQRLPRR